MTQRMQLGLGSWEMMGFEEMFADGFLTCIINMSPNPTPASKIPGHGLLPLGCLVWPQFLGWSLGVESICPATERAGL